MFDEKYHNRNDEFALRMERLGNQMNPSPRLMQAAKDGVPLRKWGNQYSAGYHLKKFAKAAMIYAVCIGLFLGIFFLLPDLPQASPPVGGNEGATELRVPHKVPKGWEAVSTDGNAVTYIRMKEGADAHHWYDQFLLGGVSNNIVTDIDTPEHMSAWNQTVTVTIYYGCFYLDDLTIIPYTTESYGDQFHAFTLYMNINGRPQSILQIKSPDELTPIAVREKENNVGVAQIGLTQGIMITLPLSELTEGSVEWELDSLAQKYCNHQGRVNLSYTQWGFRYFRSRSVLQEYLESHFPYMLFVGNSPLLILPTVVILSIVLLIRTLKKKKMPYAAFLPLLFGVVHTVIYYLMWEAFYQKNGWFDGLVESLYLLFGNAIYGGMAAIVAIFCLVAGLRRSHQRYKQKREVDRSVSPKSEDQQKARD